MKHKCKYCGKEYTCDDDNCGAPYDTPCSFDCPESPYKEHLSDKGKTGSGVMKRRLEVQMMLNPKELLLSEQTRDDIKHDLRNQIEVLKWVLETG